uniref:hypothetical protein n=1 Tax=Limnobacter sp. TaxID=2003368 RepID=UPI0025904E96
ALEQVKKNEALRPVIEQATQIAEQLYKKVGVKAAVSGEEKAEKKAAAKKPAAKKATATRTKKAAAPKAAA